MPTSDEKKRDEALKRALSMPPTRHKPLGKKKPLQKSGSKADKPRAKKIAKMEQKDERRD